MGLQIGLGQLLLVDWLGIWGMKWKQLLLHLLESACHWRRPHLTVVHLGANDFLQLSVVDLIKAIVEDVSST